MHATLELKFENVLIIEAFMKYVLMHFSFKLDLKVSRHQIFQ